MTQQQNSKVQNTEQRQNNVQSKWESEGKAD